MIKPQEVIKIGKVTKTHGVSGELSCTFINDIFGDDDAPYLVADIDGIYVPFFIEEYRFKSDVTALIKFEDIDDTDSAKLLLGRELYFPMKYITDSQPMNCGEGIIGYKIYSDGKLIGKIEGVDDSTANILFYVVTERGEELLIPATDDFVEEIDDEKREITMNLPDGLLDM
ncbi:MAG: 16S rRNA processing protein RimM [Bacteroidales bacterium]|nr:16S rRNA processing protein RimM [Bacteroidales bacterium]MBR5531797.1 16S rRNA processing protein RimM [Bacteroidales bacterium]